MEGLWELNLAVAQVWRVCYNSYQGYLPQVEQVWKISSKASAKLSIFPHAMLL